MDLATIIAVIALVGAVVGAIAYIVRKKRDGAQCIGCPVEEGCPIKTAPCCCGGDGATKSKVVPLDLEHHH